MSSVRGVQSGVIENTKVCTGNSKQHETRAHSIPTGQPYMECLGPTNVSNTNISLLGLQPPLPPDYGISHH